MTPIESDFSLRRWRAENAGSNEEQRRRLLALLSQATRTELTERQRQIVHLHFYEEKSVTQIARELNLHPSTVSRSLQRSARRLQRVLRYTV